MTKLSEDGRSSHEVRRSLRQNRQQIEEDLDALGGRLGEQLNPRRLVRRHPVLWIASGAVLGYLLIRKPALLARGLGKLAGWGAPLLLSGLINPSSGRKPAETK